MGTTKRPQEIMDCLDRNSYSDIKAEFDTRSQEEAKRIWGKIERWWREICYLAGTGTRKGRKRYTAMMRKMLLIKNRAEGGHNQ